MSLDGSKTVSKLTRLRIRKLRSLTEHEYCTQQMTKEDLLTIAEEVAAEFDVSPINIQNCADEFIKELSSFKAMAEKLF